MRELVGDLKEVQQVNRLRTIALDEALRTRFPCSINNEAVLKAFFNINADKLTFTRAIKVAAETEDAAKVAKETVFGSISERVQKVNSVSQAHKKVSSIEKNKRKCYRCGKAGHCYFKNATCNYCKLQSHFRNLFAGKRKAKRQ